jgi:negative regulator of flagellin synthesis FlgM
MKVQNDVNNVTALNVYRNESLEKAKEAAVQEGAKQQGKVTGGGDRVELSLSRGVEKLKKAAAALPDDPARQQRIQELKQQVAAGTYQVDGRQVAEKMVAQMQAMRSGGAGNEK